MSRRKKDQKTKEAVITEPIRTNLRDLTIHNFEKNHRRSCLHNLSFVGEYLISDPLQLSGTISDVVEKYNAHLSDPERITGFLLFYDRHFCVVLESGEESLYNTLADICTHLGDKLTKSKILLYIHHIRYRICPNFITYYGKPNIRISKLPTDPSLDEVLTHIKDCIKKMLHFGVSYVKLLQEIAAGPKTFAKKQSGSIGSEESEVPKKKQPFLQKTPFQDFLPEIELLNFLFETSHLPSMQTFLKYNDKIKIFHIFDYLIWPASPDYVPYNIIANKFSYQPRTSLPEI